MAEQPAAIIDEALNAARVLARSGRTSDAARLYQVVLKHDPANALALAGLRELTELSGRGSGSGPVTDVPMEKLQQLVALHGQGRFADALREAEALAASYPSSAVLANIQGVLALALGRREEAVGHLQKALSIRPDFVEVLANLGTLLTELGRPAEALAYLERAIALRPEAAEFVNALANAQSAAGLKAEAAESYRKAIRLNPSFAMAHSNLGNFLAAAGQTGEAIAAFREAVRLMPDFGDAWANLGTALRGAGRAVEAEDAYRNALAAEPGNVTAHVSLAGLLSEAGRTQEALDHYKRVWQLDPGHLAARALGLYQQALTCLWDEERRQSLDFLRTAQLAPTAREAPSPFAMLTLFDDPQLQKRAAANYLVRELRGVTPVFSIARPGPGPRIRIGYFSADFHEHATMYLMARLFELHDRDRFEVHAFSYGPDERDPMRARLLNAVEHFHDIRAMGDAEACALSRRLGIDIAVDLKGFTRDARAGIFALRAAPVQVNYLGYPGTCGSPVWDYIIADREIASEGSEEDYAEQLVLMPDSYQVNDDGRAISSRVFTRAECGLPETGFVFCCFNNSYKITPAEFDIWMRLLASVEGSVLWLLKGSVEAEGNLRREAAVRGIDPSRLVFAERLGVPDHLARHALADLFLDTFVVNAHTTASDALWAGLPVLVKKGRSFVSRVSASLVRAAELPELITANAADYEALALALARDPARLAGMKRRLKADPARLPLFDTQLYARNLELAFEEMVSISRTGEAPRKIRL